MLHNMRDVSPLQWRILFTRIVLNSLRTIQYIKALSKKVMQVNDTPKEKFTMMWFLSMTHRFFYLSIWSTSVGVEFKVVLDDLF